MKVSFDPAKRQANLAKHGLDLADAAKVLSGPCLELADDRDDYGEVRWLSVGLLAESTVVCVWTERNDEARIISLRKAEKDEQEKYFKALFG
jgi:uncharacterized DUF497 family protein